MTLARRIYRLMLYAYPKQFRERFGPEMQQAFHHFSSFILKDWLISALKERIAVMTEIVRARLWKTAKGVGVAVASLAVCLLAGSAMLQAFVIPTPSMESSLRVGDHILVNKLVHGADLRFGDMVTFRYPQDPRQTFIKRVIGLPGDHIRIANKQVIRNGHRLVEPYVETGTARPNENRDNFPIGKPRNVTNGEIVVPAGSLFVLGDNRDLSLDSRDWGFVPLANVVGRPVLVYWSYDAAAAKTRWGRTFLNLSSPAPREE